MKLISIARYSIVCVCFLSMAACSNTKHAATLNTASPQLATYGPVWAALWQQKTAEYKALCFQAYNLATLRLDEYASASHDKPFAVVTDIDETVLDNSPYSVHQGLKGLGYDDSSWMEWTAKKDCDTVPGALSFFKYAAAKNIQVFYVSNRLEAELDATIANLKKWNFPNADAEHILLKGGTSGKDARRALVAQRYSVLLFLGDNLGDFSGIYDHQSYEKRDALVRTNASGFGSHFIVLPNAMYGEWMGALLNYQYKQSQTEQSKTLLQQLKNY